MQIEALAFLQKHLGFFIQITATLIQSKLYTDHHIDSKFEKIALHFLIDLLVSGYICGTNNTQGPMKTLKKLKFDFWIFLNRMGNVRLRKRVAIYFLDC